MKINILGVDYKIIKNGSVEKYPKLKNADGYCDFTIKLIVIAKFEKDEMSVEDLDNYKNKIIRHEIIHAMLYESGLDCNSNSSDSWARNEEMVDWFAIQYPKIKNIFNKLNV